MNDMIEMVVTYGTFPILVAAAIICIFAYFKNQDKQNKKREEDLERQKREMERYEAKMSENFSKTLQAAMKAINPVHEKEEEEENQKYNEIVFDQLYKLLTVTEAARVTQVLYHNGGRDATGRSFQKESMMHEVVAFGTAQVAPSNQNLPRMLLPTLSAKIVNEGHYYVEDIETIKEEDVFSYQTFKSRGIKSFFITSLNDSSNKVLGYIGVEYADKPPEGLKKIKGHLTRKASKISGLMEGSSLK